MLREGYPLRTGLGGTSSSAAVIIDFMAALCKLNEINLTDKELIRQAIRAENEYVGVSCAVQ